MEVAAAEARMELLETRYFELARIRKSMRQEEAVRSMCDGAGSVADAPEEEAIIGVEREMAAILNEISAIEMQLV